jgi:hypothetical protein
MIGRIVITSVPQGLDGGTGFQPVLRTQGLRPSIADRLAMRAAYPHPFPFGDPRNPHIVFHRIDTVGDRTIHVLGSVRDAGSSYTGRANRLSELIAIDPAETRGLPGGPAFAARSFPWLARWAGSPREVPLGEEPVLLPVDPHDPEATGRPTRCTAWERVAGDAGWAGELAQSFLDGRRALIWAGEEVDVLELFVEAARLIPSSARWQLTFNTCEIEPFPAHWRAVRPELGLVGNYEPKNELRLVLGKLRESRSRSPDHDLARIARGEKPAQRTAPAPRTPQTPPPAYRGHGSVPPSPSPSTVPPTPSDDAALRARLKEISDDRRRRSIAGRAAGGASYGPARRSVLTTIMLLGSLATFAGAATAIAVVAHQHPDAITRWLGDRGDQNAGDSRDADLRTPQQQHDKDAAQRDAQIAAETQAREDENSQRAIAEAERKKTAERDKEALDQQEADRMAAATAAAEKRAKENNAQKELLAAQQKAFRALASKSEPTVQLLDAGPDSNLGVSDVDPQEVVLHNDFTIEHLIDPSFEFASPREGARLTITEEPTGRDNTRTWLVSGTVKNKITSDWQPAADVCRIVARENTLRLKPLVKVDNELFMRLQNSLLLISTQDPDSQASPPVPRCTILMAKPLDVRERYLLDPLAKKDTIPIHDEDNVIKRLAGINLKDLEWEITLSHPAFRDSPVLTHSATAIDRPLAMTDKGPISVTYHIIDPSGLMMPVGTATLTLNVEVCLGWKDDQDKNGSKDKPHTEFRPCFYLNPIFEGFTDDSKVLHNRIPPEKLRRATNDNAWKPIEVIVSRNLMEYSPDPCLDRLNADLAKLNKELGDILRPAVPVASTEDSRKQYNELCANKRGEIQNKRTQINDHRGTKQEKFTTDAKEAVETLKNNVQYFQPIEARIRRLDAVARDSKGNEYRIPIVKPTGD